MSRNAPAGVPLPVRIHRTPPVFYEHVDFRRFRLEKLVPQFRKGESRPEQKRFEDRIFNDYRLKAGRRYRAAGPFSQEGVSSAVVRIGMGRHDSPERNFSLLEHTGDFSSRFVIQSAVNQPCPALIQKNPHVHSSRNVLRRSSQLYCFHKPVPLIPYTAFIVRQTKSLGNPPCAVRTMCYNLLTFGTDHFVILYSAAKEMHSWKRGT
jgi:hypothetical protein